MIGRNSKLAIGILILAIVIAIVTDPRVKGGRNKAPAPAQKQQVVSQAPTPASVPSPAKKKTKPVSRRSASVAAIDTSFSDLLSENYGRNDPFAPFYDIPAPYEELIELPAIEPLAPTILHSPANMRLSAISIRDGEGMAVINGEINRVGDYVHGFRIHSIVFNRVELINDLNDRAILHIKQKIPGGFEVTEDGITNVIEKEEAPIIRNQAPPARSPLPLPPANWTRMQRETAPAPAPQKRRIKHAPPMIDIVPDPHSDAIDEIRRILSDPNNAPAGQ